METGPQGGGAIAWENEPAWQGQVCLHWLLYL